MGIFFSACGKSTWVFRLIKERDCMIDTPPIQVIYSLPSGQQIDIPDDIKNDKSVKFCRGLPEIAEFSDRKHRLLIIDDQASECGESIVSLFTRLSHHYNLSVIVLTQNIFLSNPSFRTMSLNAHYIVLFKAPRSMDQVACLGRQVCPANALFFKESYADSCSEPHSYFLLDLTQNCPDQLRFRAKIFPDDKKCTTVYIPNKSSSSGKKK